MIAKPVALLIGVVVLAFVAVSLVADVLIPGGFNVGQTIAGLYQKPYEQQLDVEKCECEYSSEYEDYVCNNYCGDFSETYCQSKADCLV